VDRHQYHLRFVRIEVGLGFVVVVAGVSSAVDLDDVVY